MGSTLYDICHTYLSSRTNLSSLASVFSCVQRLEQVLLFSIQDETLDANNAPVILSSIKWQRRISTIIPFIQVFEYEAIRRRISQGLNKSIESSKHPQDSVQKISDKDFSDTYSEKWKQGLLTGDLALMESLNPEENTTASIVEMSAKFWAGLPKHWHEDSEFTWDKITFEVEQCLVKVDSSLHAHIGMLVAKGAYNS